MKLPQRPAHSKPPVVHSFSPDPPEIEVPLAVKTTPHWRLKFRLRLRWRDPLPSGEHDEIVKFTDVRKALALLARIRSTPHRRLESAVIEAQPKPRWWPIPESFAASTGRRLNGRDAARKGAPR